MSRTDTFDLEGYIQKFGAVPLQKNEWVLKCPMCGKEDKLSVNVVKGFWHCWVCEEYETTWEGKRRPVKGAGGVLSLIKWLEGCTHGRAAAILADGSTAEAVSSLAIFEDVWDTKVEEPVRGRPISPPPNWQHIYSLLPYCKKRGITEEDVRQFGLVHCVAGRYRNRLVFPVWEGNDLMYYQARAMWEEVPGQRYIKSLNPPRVAGDGTVGPSDVLMNLDTARNYPRVAITEGPIDCIHAGPSAVCTFGKKISYQQIYKLRAAGVRAIDLMWDGPSEKEPRGAWPEMLQVAARLSGVFDVNLVFLPRGDPGEYTREELNRFRAEARPAATISRLALL